MGFNVTMIDPTYTGPKTGTLLQKGAYKLEITHSEEKATSKGDGKYVSFTFNILEPADFAGSVFYENVNTDNPNETAVRIGQKVLAGIGNAIGILEGEYDDMHHKPFVSEVVIEKGTNGHADKNKLGRIYWEDGSAPAQLGPSGPPAASTATAAPRPTVVPMTAPKPAAAAARPWGQKR